MAPTPSDDERMADTVAADEAAEAAIADVAAEEAASGEIDTSAALAPTPASNASNASGGSSAGGGDSTEEEEDDDEEDNSSDDDDGSESEGDDDESSGSNEDEPMEVEAVPTEDQDDEDDDDDQEEDEDGTTSAAKGSGISADIAKPAVEVAPAPTAVPVPAKEQQEQQQQQQQQQRKMTPKMRIKLSLKAKAAAAAAEHSSPSAVGSKPATAAPASNGSEKKAASTSIRTDKAKAVVPSTIDDDDVVMAEAHVGGEDENDEEEVIATAEIVEEVSSATDAKKTDAKSKSKPTSSTASTNNKLVESHPLHKPSRQRAPPPSLSRPQSKNPQLAYTSAAGQGGGYHSRAMRFPSILSPGMLAIPNHSNNVGTAVCDTDAYKMLHGKDDGAKLLDSDGTSGTGGSGSGDHHEDPYEKYITADSVFSHYMGAQGYTPESRTSNPHRGSSIQRTVGDMFDNDVVSSINFPNLLPDYLRSRRAPKKGRSKNSLTPAEEMAVKGSTPEKKTPTKDGQSSTADATSTITTPSDVSPKADTPAKSETPKKVEGSPAKVKMDAMDMLKSTLTSVLEKRKAASKGVQQGAAKRFRPLQFQDMVPVSLTFPYPEEYTKARIEYARKVKEREDSIAQDQIASQSAADIMENYNREKAKWEEKLTQWEKDKAEHKEKVAAWEKDQVERKERLAQWEKGRAEVEAAAAALAKKCASPKNSELSPSKEATAETDTQDKEKKEDENEPAKSSDEPPAPNTPATDSKVAPSGDDGDKKQAEEEPVLGPPRPQTPLQPTEPVLPPLPAPVSIPPIPVSPSPPSWVDSNGTDGEGAKGKGFQRPSPETLKRYATNLAHLDPATYLSTVPTPRARYVGLSSNSIADANFVGPAAHGIAGIGLGLGSGLSTAYTGASGGQGGGGLHSSSYYEGLKRFADHMGYSDVSKVSPAKKKKSSSSSGSSGSSPNDAIKEKDKEGKPKLPKIKLKMPSLPPGPKREGISSSELKSLFETGGQDAEDMRVTIIKATIYAARVGEAAGDKFVGSDGRVYDGVGKAFSNFAGIKPCERCRKSKQGALMCRVRRKHKDEDYDGGESAGELQQYFKADLKTLIRKESST